MTQPVDQRRAGSWVSDLVNRFGSDELKYKARSPIGFQMERPKFETSAFHNNLQQLTGLSRAGTNVARQIQQNRIEYERQQEMEQLRQQARQAIDLSGITPRYTGVGAGPAPTGLRQGLISPLGNYRVTSGFGPRNRPTAGASTNHGGIDMAAPTGTPIYATHTGTVAMSGWSNGYGYHVAINGAGGLQTFYGHNSRNVVKPGQQVKQGQLIGYVGSTGVSTGPHLHYEVRINGQKVNPAGYL